MHTLQQLVNEVEAIAGRRRTWLVSCVLAMAALLPVLLLSIFTYRASATRMENLVHTGNNTAAVMTGEMIRSDLARNVDMARALAAQPGMVAAVRDHDADAVRLRLKATIEAVNASMDAQPDAPRRIDRAFVTDPSGTQWSDYPHAPESIGKNFSSRDWYKGVSKTWQPYLSEVYQRNSEPRIFIVAMAAPVRTSNGKVVGVIVLQMPIAYLSKSLERVHVGGTGYVYVVDARGQVVAHPRLPDATSRIYDEPAKSPAIREALAGRSFTTQYADPISGEAMVASLRAVSMPNGTWAMVAQQPAVDVYGPIRKMGMNIALGSVIVGGTALGLVIVLRRTSIRDRRQSAELDARGRGLEKLADALGHTAAAEHAARVESQQAHDELKQTQSKLIESEKLAALGQLVAGVAHEINNPLAFVLNNVAILQRDLRAIEQLLRLYQSGDEVLATQRPDLLKEIRQLAGDIDLAYTLEEVSDVPVRSREGLIRIQQIVKDLRDFARQNAIGDVQPDADLNGGIESTLNIARGLAKKHQVELVSDLGPIPGVTCSPGKVNQVVLNLVTNAVHASPPNSKVVVRTRGCDKGIRIDVIDHGCGIDPAIRSRIFDPFFTTKPQGLGTGLGLSISHGIVSDHGGTIEAAPGEDGGTVFTITLPLCCPSEAKHETNGDGPRV